MYPLLDPKLPPGGGGGGGKSLLYPLLTIVLPPGGGGRGGSPEKLSPLPDEGGGGGGGSISKPPEIPLEGGGGGGGSISKLSPPPGGGGGGGSKKLVAVLSAGGGGGGRSLALNPLLDEGGGGRVGKVDYILELGGGGGRRVEFEGGDNGVLELALLFLFVDSWDFKSMFSLISFLMRSYFSFRLFFIASSSLEDPFLLTPISYSRKASSFFHCARSKYWRFLKQANMSSLASFL